MTDTSTEQYREQPLYWFTMLDIAVKKGDHQGAAEAQRELARLGVRVAYGRRPRPPKPDRCRTVNRRTGEVPCGQ